VPSGTDLCGDPKGSFDETICPTTSPTAATARTRRRFRAPPDGASLRRSTAITWKSRSGPTSSRSFETRGPFWSSYSAAAIEPQRRRQYPETDQPTRGIRAKKANERNRVVARLDEPISWEQKRRVVEVLIAGIRIDTVEECGVKQSKTAVTYRCSQPARAALTMTAAYGDSAVVRMPRELQTIGDQIRKRRLSLQMLQRDVAAQIGVVEACVWNWEANASTPKIRHMPGIIKFLGYNPQPAATSLPDQLVWQRTSRGLSQKTTALRLGVDQSTLGLWELGQRVPIGKFVNIVNTLLREESARTRDSVA
jgi:DNA-binding transcriptional regulator YiaG